MFRVCKHAFRKEFEMEMSLTPPNRTLPRSLHPAEVNLYTIQTIQIYTHQNASKHLPSLFRPPLRCDGAGVGIVGLIQAGTLPIEERRNHAMASLLEALPDDSTAPQVTPGLSMKHLRLLEREIKVSINPSISCGGHPWPAQELVARHLRELDPSVSVIELGCGCGALACYLALEGYDVIATDLPEMSVLTTQTAELNGAKMPFKPLAWGDEAAMKALLADLERGRAKPRVNVVACELAYWGGWDLFKEDTLEPLAKTLAFFLSHDGVALLGHVIRDMARNEMFFGHLQKNGLEIHRLEPEHEVAEGEMGVWLLKPSMEQPQ